MYGSVAYSEPDGATYVMAWAALAFRVETDHPDPYVWCRCPAGRSVSLEMVDNVGASVLRGVGRASAYIQDGQLDIGHVSIDLVDSTGERVGLRVGDRVTVVAGDDRAVLTVPPMEMHADVATDRVWGRTLPLAPVQVSLKDSSSTQSIDLTSDADGRFVADFSGVVDAAYNGYGRVMVAVGRHEVTYYAPIPGMMLDLDTGVLQGAASPGATVEAIVVHQGQPRNPLTTVTDVFGHFELPFYPASAPCGSRSSWSRSSGSRRLRWTSPWRAPPAPPRW
jgi:hypothetical protein